jgi:cell division protein FtsW
MKKKEAWLSGLFKAKHNRPVDKYLLGTILALLLFGLMVLFSASLVTAYSSQGDAYFYIRKQLMALFIGVPALFILSRVDYHFYKKYAFLFLIFSFILLILVFVPGLRSEYGSANRWIVIFGNSFQVSEAVKLLLIFYLAAWVESRKEDLKKFSTGLLPFLLVVMAVGVLLLIQPDLGTFLLVFVIALSMYFVAGGNMKQLTVMFLIGVASFLYFYSQASNQVSSERPTLIREYQLNRIRCLQDPSYDRNACYQINQSLIAVGSGGLWGRGLGNSLQKYNYLPEVWADSIFPVIAEELGFVGSLLLVLVYLFIFIKGFLIAKRAPDMYGQTLAIGISVWIFFQAFLNIGGMINLIPMTGVSLPFISAGGTSLLFLLIAMGILLNIDRQGISGNSRDNKRIKKVRI